MASASDPQELRALVQRAIGRALADPSSAGSSSVHVAVDPRRPAMEEATTRPRSLDTLVTLECLEGVPDGGTLRVPAGARFTPAAEDEIWRRGLRLGPPEASELPAGPLRIAVGSDHGGFELKAELKDWLAELGHHARDLGTHDPGSCDYPDYARAVAEAVASGQADLGVCIDGAGIGSAMTANKVPGVLAAPAWSEASARNAREHNHATVLSLGAGLLSRGEAHSILRAFLAARPGDGRHARRVAKILDLDVARRGASASTRS